MKHFLKKCALIAGVLNAQEGYGAQEDLGQELDGVVKLDATEFTPENLIVKGFSFLGDIPNASLTSKATAAAAFAAARERLAKDEAGVLSDLKKWYLKGGENPVWPTFIRVMSNETQCSRLLDVFEEEAWERSQKTAVKALPEIVEACLKTSRLKSVLNNDRLSKTVRKAAEATVRGTNHMGLQDALNEVARDYMNAAAETTVKLLRLYVRQCGPSEARTSSVTLIYDLAIKNLKLQEDVDWSKLCASAILSHKLMAEASDSITCSGDQYLAALQNLRESYTQPRRKFDHLTYLGKRVALLLREIEKGERSKAFPEVQKAAEMLRLELFTNGYLWG